MIKLNEEELRQISSGMSEREDEIFTTLLSKLNGFFLRHIADQDHQAYYLANVQMLEEFRNAEIPQPYKDKCIHDIEEEIARVKALL